MQSFDGLSTDDAMREEVSPVNTLSMITLNKKFDFFSLKETYWHCSFRTISCLRNKNIVLLFDEELIYINNLKYNKEENKYGNIFLYFVDYSIYTTNNT